MPKPAVRLSPSTTILGATGASGALGASRALGAAGALGATDLSRRSSWASGGAGAERPHEIAASTTRQRRTRFNPLYLTLDVVYSRPWSPSPSSRRWRAHERLSSVAAMP